MVQPRENIPITEVWNRSSWANFDTYQAVTNATMLGRSGDNALYNFGLSTQGHINIRTFIEPGGWSGGLTTGYVASVNHWPGATAALSAGLHTFTSLYTTAIDLTAIGSSSQLVMALPNFPLANVDLTNSFLDLSSDGFNSAICSLQWSTSLTAPIAGNSALTWAYSSLAGIDLTKVTGVRLRITATNACTVLLMALRLIMVGWVQTNLDFDNLDGQLRQSIPLTGDTTLAAVPNNQTLPSLWRSAAIPGIDDPRPVNAEIGFLFNTGSQTQSNSLSLFMRENSEAFITQLDLQGETQGLLTGEPQPTLGISELAPRTMGDLDRLSVGGLDGQTVGNLESVNSVIFSSWIGFTVFWGTTTGIEITNSVNPVGGYQFGGFSLANNTTYLAVCNLTDTTARLQIYNVNQSTLTLGTIVYDTTLIPDTSVFPRRSGRVGFQANLQDGDAYIGAIRPRGLMFAEYRSASLQSITPVGGARLYVDSTPEVELFTGWSPLADGAGNSPILTVDQQRYVRTHSDHQSTLVTVTTPSVTSPAQGVISNWLSPSDDATSGITDFAQLHLEFALWVPASLQGAQQSLSMSLISSTAGVLPINLPPLIAGQWQTFSILRPFAQPYPRSGLYQLVIRYLGTVSTTFWIDDVSVHEETIAWDARSVVDDPWHSNYAPWTPFLDLTNSDTSGVHFSTQGSQLQMRAQALKQDVSILNAPKLVPIYAELGRLVWPEDAPPVGAGPTAVLSATNVGRSYTFNASASSGPDLIGDFQWAFGDGNLGSGQVAHYTYPSWIPAGTAYTVVLTVIDRAGRIGTTTIIVTL